MNLERQLAERAELLEQLGKLGIERIVFAERAPGSDYQKHYYANFGYSCVDPDYWLHGADGGRLLVLNVPSRQLDILLDDPGGAVRDPQVHYDGTKILFSYRRGGTHHYNLYEIEIETAELRQLTDGALAQLDPDTGKLTTLAAGGRSTATTVLSLSTIRQLRRDETLKRKARKLLSFTRSATGCRRVMTKRRSGSRRQPNRASVTVRPR